MIDYFISYSFMDSAGNGYGNAHIFLEDPIKGFRDIGKAERIIMVNEPEIKKLTILFWKRFEETETE